MRVDYPAERTVSVWTGTFSSEDEFDRSIDNYVSKRLGLSTPIESICEVEFRPEAVPIRELIEGFSGWETFIDSIVAVAANHGCNTANAALVCYYVKCAEAPTIWGNLHFLGSFPGQDVT
jgi:hypothetical protein